MMLLTKMNCRGLVPTFFILSTIMIYGFDVSQAFAGKKHRAFKNNDVVSANDFHVNKSGGQIKSAANRRVASGNKSFPDKAFGTAVDSFDWTAAELNAGEEILPGGILVICTTGGAANTATSYFTKDAVEIDTTSIRVRANWTRVTDTTEHIFATITNDNIESVEITNLEIRIDSTGDLSIPGEFVPDGTIVTSIPGPFTLLPGETEKYLLLGYDPSLIVSMSCDVALASAVSDTFLQLDAELVSDLSLVPVPTVSEWGMAVMALLVLVAGSIVLRRVAAQRLA